ncbi:fibrillin-1-like [Haliotis cracherodii]|uniref:fibrillin-1-like n=1 Tax=Haliotis cracherodii TaxID=6455 RepID=UPI0039E7417D
MEGTQHHSPSPNRVPSVGRCNKRRWLSLSGINFNMEMGRYQVIACIVISLSLHSQSFIHYKDLFAKPPDKGKEAEKRWKKCEPPGQIRNGQVVVWGDGLLLEYICDKNFFAYGLTHGGCDPTTGKWTILPPVCVASGCPDLLPPRHGVVNIDNNGGVATFTCEAGYYVLGSAKLFCEEGRWRGRFPFCAVSAKSRPTSAPPTGVPNAALRHADESCFQYQIDPPTVEKAVFTTSYVFSKFRGRYIMIATYSCVGGYKLSDPSSTNLYCHNSQWGARIRPKCVLEDDPCQNGNGGCAHMCVSRVGRYSCTCRDGYTLGSDFRSCFDLNECILKNGGCAHDCHNTIGSFFCSCGPGFLVNGKGCVDIDECAGAMHTCPGPCVNLPGSYKCDCSIPGYQPSSADHFCEDFDECSFNNGECDDICINRRGSYECRCDQKGLKLADDLHSCVDFNECERYGEKLCRHGYCVNLDGSYRCECESGFEPGQDGTYCEDTDECLNNNGGCNDRCENQFGYFNCYCDMDGFLLGEDGFTCADIDECAIEADQCEDQCVNVPGYYSCECLQDGFVVAKDNITCTECEQDEYYSRADGACHPCPANSIVSSQLRSRFAQSHADCACRPGFEGDPPYNIPCIDRDECSLGEIYCEYGCINQPGSAQCDCPPGYTSEADKVNCVDIDECAVNQGGCNHICINTDSSYNCECDGDGYIMMEDQHTCQDINECEDPRYCSHGCENVEGSVVCLCPQGYQLDLDLRTCVDFDECSAFDPPCDQICINSLASFECGCRYGYKLSWNKTSCIDVNECMEGESVCQEGCINTIGSFKCVCNTQGYVSADDGAACVDVNECSLNTTKSLCQQECINLPGTYRCGCHAGYRKAGATKCAACLRGYYRDRTDKGCQRCPPRSSTKSGASTSIASCLCRTGYVGDPSNNIPCTDFDECSSNTLGCSHICMNTDGSAYCTCPGGYRLTPDRKTCQDVDECATSSNVCDQNCVNTIGSYQCGCDLRYFTTSNDRTCIDINECDDNNYGCAHQCVNTNGGAHCTCPAGYVIIEGGKECTDLDECATDNGGCDDVCINTIGSFNCECRKAGFEQYHYNTKKCVDVNECMRDSPCQDLCKNTYGSYKCRCRGTGLLLSDNGRDCYDINECLVPNICDHKCVNLRGTYRCECRPGFYYDGAHCKLCPLGTYSPKFSNRRACVNCPAKSLTLQKGSTSITKCVCAQGFAGTPSDGVTCMDINECDVENGQCEHRCINSPGSFSCTCRLSYTLQDDMKSCRRVTCPTLDHFPNGRIWPPACTSPLSLSKLKKGTICSFRCSRGYELNGERYRSCLANSSWSGSQPFCEGKYCTALTEPKNGSVRPRVCLADSIPFKQRCMFICNKGYTMIGKPATKCKANQRWSNSKKPKCVPEKRKKRTENDV